MKRQPSEKVVGLRLSAELFDKIRKCKDILTQKNPGVRINQSDAIRTMLEKFDEATL